MDILNTIEQALKMVKMINILYFFFKWSIADLALCSFHMYSKVIQVHTYTCMCVYMLTDS